MQTRRDGDEAAQPAGERECHGGRRGGAVEGHEKPRTLRGQRMPGKAARMNWYSAPALDRADWVRSAAVMWTSASAATGVGTDADQVPHVRDGQHACMELSVQPFAVGRL